MDRIQEIKERLKEATLGINKNVSDTQWGEFVAHSRNDIAYLLAENKRLEEVLKKIVHRATAYTNIEVPAIVLDEVRGMAALATNPWLREEGK